MGGGLELGSCPSSWCSVVRERIRDSPIRSLPALDVHSSPSSLPPVAFLLLLDTKLSQNFPDVGSSRPAERETSRPLPVLQVRPPQPHPGPLLRDESHCLPPAAGVGWGDAVVWSARGHHPLYQQLGRARSGDLNLQRGSRAWKAAIPPTHKQLGLQPPDDCARGNLLK